MSKTGEYEGMDSQEGSPRSPAVATVSDYVDTFDGLTRERLDELRDLIVATVPDAVEGISHSIPAYRLAGRTFAFFAGWSEFVSLYPIADLPPSLASAMAPYQVGKATARFSNTEPLPRDLIERLVRHMADRRLAD